MGKRGRKIRGKGRPKLWNKGQRKVWDKEGRKVSGRGGHDEWENYVAKYGTKEGSKSQTKETAKYGTKEDRYIVQRKARSMGKGGRKIWGKRRPKLWNKGHSKVWDERGCKVPGRGGRDVWEKDVAKYGTKEGSNYGTKQTARYETKEKHRLRMFEKRMQRRIFGPKRDEVRRGWIILHNEKLRDLYSSPIMITVVKFLVTFSTRILRTATVALSVEQLATSWTTKGSGVRASIGSRILTSPYCPYRFWDPPILLCNGYRGALSSVIRRPGRESDHSPPASANVKRTWLYTSTPPYVSMA
jgi:hypothetical protein